MSWCVEEYTEDAIVKYLASKLDDAVLNIYTAWTDEEIKYPCTVIHAGKSGNVAGTAFNGIRTVDVTIAVMTEAAAAGAQTARQRNAAARNLVIEALAQTVLQDDINALAPDGIVFSLAYIGDITRSVESDKRVFVSEIQLIIIVAPKELI